MRARSPRRRTGCPRSRRAARHEVGRRRSAAERGHQLGDLAAREPVERRRWVSIAVAAQRGDQLRQRVVVVDLGVAVGAEEHRAPRLRRPDQVAQQLQRRAVGPLQVVEHEQQRRAGGDLRQQRGERVEQPLALDARLGLDRRAPRRRAELGQQRREVGGARAEPLGGAGQRGAARPAAQHLEHRLVGAGAGLVEAPEEDDRAVAVDRARELGRQARLADPRVAGEQDEAPLVADRRVPRLVQGAERLLAADERVPRRRGLERGRQRAGREAGRRGRLGRRARRRAAAARGAPSPRGRAPCRARRAASGAARRTPAAPRRGCPTPRGPPSAAGGRTRGTAPARSRCARRARRRRARGRRGAAPPRRAPRARAGAGPRPRGGGRAPTARRTRPGTARRRARARRGPGRRRPPSGGRRAPGPRPRRRRRAPRCRPTAARAAPAAAQRGRSARPARARGAASTAARRARSPTTRARPSATARPRARSAGRRASGGRRGRRAAAGPGALAAPRRSAHRCC